VDLPPEHFITERQYSSARFST